MANFLLDLAYYLIVLPVLLGLIRWRALSRIQTGVAYLVFFWFAINLASLIGARCFGTNRLIFQLNLPGEFFLLGMIFWHTFRQRSISRTIPWIIAGFTLLWILNLLIGAGVNEIPVMVRAVESFLVITMSLLYFYYLLRDMHAPNLFASPMFWFASGSLIYFAAGLIPTLYVNEIQALKDAVSARSIWAIHSALLIPLYIFYSISLLCKEKTSTSSKAS